MSHLTIDQSIFLTIDWQYTIAWFPAFLLKTHDMRNDDARTVRLWKETLCNKGENEAWFGIFRLQ